MPTFTDVAQAEEAEIKEARRRRGVPNNAGVVGLAFSGGGIRSATFNLGVLQGLAAFRLLKRIDYLSTVSGGGYIGSWFANWIKRTSIDTVERELGATVSANSADPKYQEPKPVNFLREYSNYLTPRIGILGADTWAAVAGYLRNLSLNLAILVSIMAALLLIPRFVQILFVRSTALGAAAGLWSLAIAAIFMVAALAATTLNVADFSVRECEGRHSEQHIDTEDRPGFTDQKWVLTLVVLPVFISAFFGTFALWSFRSKTDEVPLWWWLAAGGAAYFALRLLGIAVGRGAGSLFAWQERTTCVENKEKNAEWIVLLSAPFAGLLGGFLLHWVGTLVCTWTSAADLVGFSTLMILGPPSIVAAVLLTGVLHIGLMGLLFENQRREWWARCAGWMLLGCLSWVALFGLAVYAPVGAILLSGLVKTKITAILAWAGSTLTGVIGGSSSKTSGKAGGNKILEVAASVAPYVFIVGLLVFISCGLNSVVPPEPRPIQGQSKTRSWVTSIIEMTSSAQSSNASSSKGDTSPAATANPAADISSQLDAYWRRWESRAQNGAGTPQTSLLPRMTYWWAGLVIFSVALAFRVDINEFSLHLFYRNRLVRCYLGASNPTRDAQRFTGFDPTDDALLATFSTKVDQHYAGPYPILNTALNLTHGERLAWQERKAESFVFSPRYCGFEFQEERPHRVSLTWAEPTSAQVDRNALAGGYRETESYAYPPQKENGDEIGGVFLGTAFSISGAAASPNMGYHTSPALAFMMTIFDVRLGWWLGNPRRQRTWQHSSPQFSLPYLLCELLASTDDRSGYIYLSDGGHFENLGVYELVRRGCPYIIACDAGQDAEMGFSDLGNAIRKCRSDFGVEIDICLDKIKPKKDAPFSERYCAVGDIHYPNREAPGKLFYIKASLTGKEPQDVLAYKAAHSEFPHQTTADQWFDEAQFESYKRLGQFVVECALKDLGERQYVAEMTTEDLFDALSAKYGKS